MRKEWKEKIRQAFEAETPDLCERIENACAQETQYDDEPIVKTSRSFFSSLVFRRAVAAALSVALFCGGLFVGKQVLPDSTPSSPATVNTLVYLDTESSIELQLDANGNVLGCSATNANGEPLLPNIRLQGMDMQTALSTIVGSLYVKGDLGAERNSVLISVDTRNAGDSGELLSSIKNHVNEVFADSNMQCSIIAQNVETNEELQRRAREQGISVGKMALVDKLMGSLDNVDSLDEKELATLSIKELNLIYSMRPNRTDRPWTDVVSGKVNGYIGEKEAISAVAEYLQTSEDKIWRYELFVAPSKIDPRVLVYRISIQLQNDEKIYKYEVDCVTGEVEQCDALWET